MKTTLNLTNPEQFKSDLDFIIWVIGQVQNASDSDEILSLLNLAKSAITCAEGTVRINQLEQKLSKSA